MKTKLHEILAVANGRKTRATKRLAEARQQWKADLITGISRTYAPLAEDGERLPSESKRVQVRVPDVVRKIAAEMVEFHDVLATLEHGNTRARADVVVDDRVILSDVPVTLLLFLEKQLAELAAFIGSVPTLPTDKDWTFSTDANSFVTEATEQVRTQKIPTAFVKYEATEEHPAQVDVVHVDKVVGTWTTRHFSGAIPAKVQSDVLARLVKLNDAVKIARERANSTEVEQARIGKDVLAYVFEELLE